MNFQDKLNNQESDFDPQAWDQMMMLMDTESNDKQNTRIYKWLFLGVSIILFLTLFFVFRNVWNNPGIYGENQPNTSLQTVESISAPSSVELNTQPLNDEESSVNSISKDRAQHSENNTFHAASSKSTVEIDNEKEKSDAASRSTYSDPIEIESSKINELFILHSNPSNEISTKQVVNRRNNMPSRSELAKVSNREPQSSISHSTSNQHSDLIKDESNEKPKDLLLTKIGWKKENLEWNKTKIKYRKTPITTKDKLKGPYPFNTIFIGSGISRRDYSYNGYNVELGMQRSFNRFVQLSSSISYQNLEDRIYYAIKNEERGNEHIGKFSMQLALTPLYYRGLSFRVYGGGYYSYGVLSRRIDGISVPVNEITTVGGFGAQLYWNVGFSLYYELTKNLHIEAYYNTDNLNHYNLRIHKTFTL